MISTDDGYSGIKYRPQFPRYNSPSSIYDMGDYAAGSSGIIAVFNALSCKINISENFGINWKMVDMAAPCTNTWETPRQAWVGNGGRLWVRNYFELYFSDDAGDTWKSLNAEFPAIPSNLSRKANLYFDQFFRTYIINGGVGYVLSENMDRAVEISFDSDLNYRAFARHIAVDKYGQILMSLPGFVLYSGQNE